MTAIDQHLSHLPPAAAQLGRIAARPRLIAIAIIAALSGLGWIALAAMSVQEPNLFAALCRPTLTAAWTASAFATVFLMWAAMVLAMMLPSAAPMVLTYVEIAATARQKGSSVVTPFMLLAGYALVWLGFALFAATLNMLSQGLVADLATGSRMFFAGAMFILAGAYQFSAVKHACVRLCRQPFQFFFSNWKTTPRGVFGLGLRQGVYCLGCCWAMMLLMLTAGAMNVVWMAALGILMTAEKLRGMEKLTHITGVGLVVVGAALMVSSAIL